MVRRLLMLLHSLLRQEGLTAVDAKEGMKGRMMLLKSIRMYKGSIALATRVVGF